MVIRPFITASKTCPPFPLVVYCRTESDVEELSGLQALVQSININLPYAKIARTIIHAPVTAQTFSEHTRFYPVVYGGAVGIYFKW